MAELPEPGDPTLEAADRALEAIENAKAHRPYLGMSSIGHECARKSWYEFRWATPSHHNAATLKLFADGHHGEDLQASRLRRVHGVKLLTVDPETGQQFGFEDHNGHFRGHMDGAITGLVQDPDPWRVWEHKQTGDKKQTELVKLKADKGEGQALAAWNMTYYVQGVLYMSYSGMTSHYLTCSTPGGRSTISVLTAADEATATRYKAKAERIINADKPPERLSNDPTFWQCKMCQHGAVCHAGKIPEATCRSCAWSEAAGNARWYCGKLKSFRTIDEQQRGCVAHITIPALVPGTQVDAAEDGSWIKYEMPDGTTYVEGVPY